ncbi:MAG: hypothetical protein EZS28_024058 [Streblomastix strix]|uniref:Uncharacterized protein n=1 Tax=Streblomastix strix TaxID=222440 RepID=A0A5J4VDF5_9EUKA|nr:MAG: hypothetical protein EZS28_024058 [Streblomastix strix]
MQHSDYISGYMQLGEVLKTLTIHVQSFAISKEQFFDQPVNQLTSSGVRYTRAPLAARGAATCSIVQICQVNWTITIPANILAIQLNRCEVQGADANNLNARVNFNAKANHITPNDQNMQQANQFYYGKAAEGPENSEHLNVSPLESIIAGKRHCGVFIDIPLCDIDQAAGGGTPYIYLIPYDITFSGVLDLNQLNPIFNSFQVLTRNYASLYLQLWVQDFLQDLKIVWLNKSDIMGNNHLAYAMIPPEKPDIVYLLSRLEDEDPLNYSAGFQSVSGSMQSIMSFANIKALFMTFAMPQYPTCTDSNNQQLNVCSVDQDVVSAPSDLYHSLTFENVNVNDKDDFYGHVDAGGDLKANANIFYYTTLFNRSKATKTSYPNKYMLAWKMATDDSFMRGQNSSKIGIVDTTQLNPSQNQNDFNHFIGMRSYPDPHQVALTPIMQYLCNAFIRITFNDIPDPQVLSMDVIGEIGGSSVRSG